MSQLIYIRRRIKAVQTIKKITNAMRLVSRALHSQMNQKRPFLKSYKESLQKVFQDYSDPDYLKNSCFFPALNAEEKKLTIVLGSQKGLCGTYNSTIFYWLNNHKLFFKKDSHDLITLGKKAQEQAQTLKILPIKYIEELKFSTLEKVTQELLNFIINASPHYTQVTFVSNYSKTFFSHFHKETIIIPLTTALNKPTSQENQLTDFVWLNNQQDLVNKFSLMYAKTMLQELLFEGLMSEQAARFIAMDNACRNANNLLDTMKLQYNKLRQTKITKELIELAGSFKQNNQSS